MTDSELKTLKDNLCNRIRLVIPVYEVQKEANKIFSKLHKEIGALLKQNAILVKQRDALLPRLMSGKPK